MSAEIIPLYTPPRLLGAAPDEWHHFDLGLGLTEDLMPVVCGPGTISPRSNLKPSDLGRVPSLLNYEGHVTGISNWTKMLTTGGQIRKWMQTSAYGICINCRLVRGLDIDVLDPVLADAIASVVERELGMKLPTRRREGVAKRLLAVKVDGEFGKRRLSVAGGQIVELLANGQMFVAVGSRLDGSRYYWDGGLPDDIPTITMEQLERIWLTLEIEFAVEASVISPAPGEGKADIDADDPVADYLAEKGLVLGESSRGLNVACPWQDEHTGGETGDGSTMWLHAGGKGNEIGHFKCMHAHCAHRSRADYLEAVGYVEDVSSMFDVIEDTPEEAAEAAEKAARFAPVPVAEILKRKSPGWLVKDTIPDADLVLVYGASGSGKSFVMIDLAMALARGVPWFGRKVRQCPVVYVCAEGAGGFGKRLRAYALQNNLDLKDVPIWVIEAAPNLLKADDLKALIQAIKPLNPAIVVMDTLARMTPGANENAGEDMGLAIDNCSKVTKATGARVFLVHHTGKDESRGARGWSGMRAASDAEFEIVRDKTTGKRWIETTKEKDTADEGRVGFKLETVVVDIDDDGDAVTSCVLGADEAPEMGRAREPKAETLGVWEVAVMETLAELQLGGDVLKTELPIVVAQKMADRGTVKFCRASARRALKNLSSGKKSRLIVEGDYVFDRQ